MGKNASSHGLGQAGLPKPEAGSGQGTDWGNGPRVQLDLGPQGHTQEGISHVVIFWIRFMATVKTSGFLVLFLNIWSEAIGRRKSQGHSIQELRGGGGESHRTIGGTSREASLRP